MPFILHPLQSSWLLLLTILSSSIISYRTLRACCPPALTRSPSPHTFPSPPSITTIAPTVVWKIIMCCFTWETSHLTPPGTSCSPPLLHYAFQYSILPYATVSYCCVISSPRQHPFLLPSHLIFMLLHLASCFLLTSPCLTSPVSSSHFYPPSFSCP